MANALKILYIEDQSAYVKIFKKMLEEFNIDIFIATNGTSGVKTFELMEPDLVFLDINLPGISGYVVLRRIKKFIKDNSLHSKIIMLSSNKDKDNVTNTIQAGANDYMIKPFEQKNLVDRIKKHFPNFDLTEKKNNPN